MAHRRTYRSYLGRTNSNHDLPKSSTPTINRLSPAEAKERRDKGLCYNCDENFVWGYRCKVQRLFLLERNWSEDESDALESEVFNGNDEFQEKDPIISQISRFMLLWAH